MAIENVWSREQTYGGTERRQPGRTFNILVKDFTSNEQGVPIRLIYGTAKVAGIYITPIFGFRSTAISTEVGK